MVSLEIGLGIPISGLFSDINWGSNAFFCKMEVDLLIGQGYELVDITHFISAPYSLYSGSAGTVESIDYSQITNTPNFTGWDDVVSDDFSGNYNDLTILPTLFDGDYNSLTNLPSIPSDLSDLTDNASLLFSRNYNDLTNQPDFTGWDTNAGDDFSGNYNELTSLPINIF